MRKIVFCNGEEIEVSGITKTGDTINISFTSADVMKVLNTFRDNPAATTLMRYYVGADLIAGYKGFTSMAELTYVPDVTESIDYTTEDPRTRSGFAETYSDVITVHMEKASYVQEAEDSNALAAEVQSLKEDISAINAALGGVSNGLN